MEEQIKQHPNDIEKKTEECPNGDENSGEHKKAKMIKEVMKTEGILNTFNNPTLRIRELVDQRKLAMKLFREFTSLSFHEIGMFWQTDDYKGKNHASVMHNVKKADELIQYDKKFMYRYSCCVNKIKRNLYDNDYSDETVYDQLRKARELNMKLINREIQRKSQREFLINAIRYFPKSYIIRLNTFLRSWEIHL